jgi:hypothetical protein
MDADLASHAAIRRYGNEMALQQNGHIQVL